MSNSHCQNPLFTFFFPSINGCLHITTLESSESRSVQEILLWHAFYAHLVCRNYREGHLSPVMYLEKFFSGCTALCYIWKLDPLIVLLFTFNDLGTPSDMGKFFPAIHQTIDAGWNPITPPSGSQFQSECAVRTSVSISSMVFFLSLFGFFAFIFVED